MQFLILKISRLSETNRFMKYTVVTNKKSSTLLIINTQVDIDYSLLDFKSVLEELFHGDYFIMIALPSPFIVHSPLSIYFLDVTKLE